jgi:hypothetical protein
MSDTPQTDAFENLGFLDQQMTWIDFARQLERELAAKEKEIADAKTVIANMTEALEAVLESPLPARTFFTLAAALYDKKEASK